MKFIEKKLFEILFRIVIWFQLGKSFILAVNEMNDLVV